MPLEYSVSLLNQAQTVLPWCLAWSVNRTGKGGFRPDRHQGRLPASGSERPLPDLVHVRRAEAGALSGFGQASLKNMESQVGRPALIAALRKPERGDHCLKTSNPSAYLWIAANSEAVGRANG